MEDRWWEPDLSWFEWRLDKPGKKAKIIHRVMDET